GCRIEISNPYLIPSTDVFLHLTFHPAPTPEPDTCPSRNATSSNSRHVQDEGRDLKATPKQEGEPWEKWWLKEQYDDLLAACEVAEEIGSPAVIKVEVASEVWKFLVADPDIQGYVGVPTIFGDLFRIYLRPNVDALVIVDGAHAALTRYEWIPRDLDRGWSWVQDHFVRLWFGSHTVTTSNQTSSDLVPTSPPIEHVSAENSCNDKFETCVFGIDGGPNQQGAIPLSSQSIQPQNVAVPAPIPKIKNQIITAPPFSPRLKSVRVSTLRDHSSARIDHTIELGGIYVLAEDEFLESISNNTR
ncbi:hypothetical protein LQL77_31545, partial [Rhodococcus cerastii]|nr:hypothetical protein [Rhodococcus cerastii]